MEGRLLLVNGEKDDKHHLSIFNELKTGGIG
jgi:hypothetical protein